MTPLRQITKKIPAERRAKIEEEARKKIDAMVAKLGKRKAKS